MNKLLGAVKNKTFKAGIAYTVGNILIKGINFATLPLFSRIMTTEEFGVYNVFLSYEAILFVLIGFAIHGSLQSANLEFKGKIDQYTSSVSLVYLASLLFLVIVESLFGGVLNGYLGFDTPIVFCLIAYSFGSSLIMLYNTRISIDYNYKSYLIISFCSSVGNVMVSLLLMFTLFKSNHVLGRVVGVTTVTCLIVVYIFVVLYKKAFPRYDKNYIRFALKYSLPIVPHGLAQVLLAQFDRIMVRDIVGDGAAGVYGLAGNVQLILNVITTSIATVWATWFFRRADENDSKSIIKRADKLVFYFLVFCVLVLCFSPELVLLVGGIKYYDSNYVVAPLIVVGFILFEYNIIVQAEYYKKKTVYIMIGTCVAAGINVVLNLIFINLYGFVAAAYTTLFSYLCYLALHYIISRKVLGYSILSLFKLLIYFIQISIITVFVEIAIDAIFCRIIIFVFASCLFLVENKLLKRKV